MLDAEERKKQMRGFKEAEKVSKMEQIQRLRNMTPEDSLKIYNDLCEFYYSQHPVPDEGLDRERIQFLIHRRRSFDILAGGKSQ